MTRSLVVCSARMSAADDHHDVVDKLTLLALGFCHQLAVHASGGDGQRGKIGKEVVQQNLSGKQS